MPMSTETFVGYLKQIQTHGSFYQIEKWNNGWAVIQTFPLEVGREDEFVVGIAPGGDNLLQLLQCFSEAGEPVTIMPFAVNKSF